MSMPIPLQYKFKIKVTTTYTRTYTGNKKDTKRMVDYDIEDNDFRAWDRLSTDSEIVNIERRETLYE